MKSRVRDIAGYFGVACAISSAVVLPPFGGYLLGSGETTWGWVLIVLGCINVFLLLGFGIWLLTQFMHMVSAFFKR